MTKKSKIPKIEPSANTFLSLWGFVVSVREGCGVVGGVMLMILDLDCQR